MGLIDESLEVVEVLALRTGLDDELDGDCKGFVPFSRRPDGDVGLTLGIFGNRALGLRSDEVKRREEAGGIPHCEELLWVLALFVAAERLGHGQRQLQRVCSL